MRGEWCWRVSRLVKSLKYMIKLHYKELELMNMGTDENQKE